MREDARFFSSFEEADAASLGDVRARSRARRLALVQAIREAHWGLYGGAPTGMERVSRLAITPSSAVLARGRARGSGARARTIYEGSRRPRRAKSRKRAPARTRAR